LFWVQRTAPLNSSSSPIGESRSTGRLSSPNASITSMLPP
jgi:hypothetical protein